jgi:hypothetical protein
LLLPATLAADDPQIPRLAWTPRSDWLNVKDVGAAGDGQADDTAAIQKALEKIGDGATLYLPPGNYRIAKTVRLTGPLIGVSVIGHGRDTTLVWDGEAGGKVFADDGVAYSRFVGIQFDGRGKAAVGFHHDSHKRFETEVRHIHLAFRNFTDAAVLAEPRDRYALAETEFNNCLFEDCGRGVVFVSFNDYNYTFDGCELRRCGVAIDCRHGNFYVRNTHFVGSREVDIRSRPEHGCSVRRCTSVGSRAFLVHQNGVSPMTVQDCHVDGWTNPDGAVVLASAPVMMFDCAFTGGPAGQSPVNIKAADQRLVVSENRVTGAPHLIRPGHKGRVYVVPAGERHGSVTSASQRFLRSTASVPGRVFDAKTDFGAKGDGRSDDTAAIQRTIDAARKHGDGAIAYVPAGRYNIHEMLQIKGSDFYVGGTGFRTSLVWRGAEGGKIVHVHDPQDVTLENIAVGNHDAGQMNNAIDILQTGSDRPSRMTYDGVFAYGMYQKRPNVKGFHFRGLTEHDTVVTPHVQGNLRLIDSARATVLLNCSYEGSIIVEGRDPRRGGLLGSMTRLATITTHGLYLRDNQSIVMSDFYVEQAMDGVVLEGQSDRPPGRATIQGAKVDFTHGGKGQDGMVLDSRNYHGEVFFGPNQFYASLPRVPIRHMGEAELDLFLWANSFYQTHLEVESKGALRVHRIANHGVAIDDENKTLSHENRAEDNLPAGELHRLVPALDDLRRLGEVDLRLNHPDAR